MIGDWIKNETSISELSRTFGVSRVTIYKWLERFKAEGPVGIKEHSRAPHKHPNAVPEEMVKEIISARMSHPFWGPKKIQDLLQEQYPDEDWPSQSTMTVIFRREGLVKPRRTRHLVKPYAQPFLECDGPNKVWSADFKGQFRMKDRKVCYPLTITDNYSRFILLCRGLEHPNHNAVMPWFEAVFRQYGLPEAIRTDNGPPFASTGLAGLSRLSAWFIKLGIRHERIDKGHPEQNGRHERMHRTLKEETCKTPQSTLRAQQQAFNGFIHEYNFSRPHEALDMRKPGDLYQKSDRHYSRRISNITYDPAFYVRSVRPSGEIKWHGKLVYLTQALSGEKVGLLQLQNEHEWEIRYGSFKLGVLDNYSCEIKV
jgi:transposase InsO family protein